MKKQKSYYTALLKMITAYALVIGIIASIFLFFLSGQFQKKTQKIDLSPSYTPIPTTQSDVKFCGGIAGIACPTDYSCKLDGNYPDAGGHCIKGI